MNLHIVEDEKFINGAIDLFEKYSPGNNIFIVNGTSDRLKYVVDRKEVVAFKLSKIGSVDRILAIIKNDNIEKIFIHFLTPLKSYLSNKAKEKYQVKIYWIFYGAELYQMLNKDFSYQLHDRKAREVLSLNSVLAGVSAYVREKASFFKFYFLNKEKPRESILSFLGIVDYFCFWNYHDYALLKKHYKTSAKFLYFAHFNSIDVNSCRGEVIVKQNLKVVLNNSASLSGNHTTLLRRIHEVDKNKRISELIVPLNYGSQKVLKETTQAGIKLFGSRFNPLLRFLDAESYFKLLGGISVGFFGARRQEGSGNIIQLIAFGAKVFLRNDNNMLKYLKENNFIVFSFEDDFKSSEDLDPLSTDQIIHNQSLFTSLFNEEKERSVMKAIIES